ncbi:hypothetical protein LTR08_006964 [Meristemomyces frigidus]|nr:hypothetical protein LTR08_006964 [Meristemomyces frigidus]
MLCAHIPPSKHPSIVDPPPVNLPAHRSIGLDPNNHKNRATVQPSAKVANNLSIAEAGEEPSSMQAPPDDPDTAHAIPARIHVRHLDSYRGVPVSYMGEGWYRPVLPGRHLYHGSLRPGRCVTRVEYRQAVARFARRQVERALLVPGQATESSDSRSEVERCGDGGVVCTGRTPGTGERPEGAASPPQLSKRCLPVGLLQAPAPADAVELEQHAPRAQGPYRKSGTRSTSTWQKPPSGQCNPTFTLQQVSRAEAEAIAGPKAVHFTALAQHPGLQFRAVGNGHYIRDDSRTGEWVPVPHK